LPELYKILEKYTSLPSEASVSIIKLIQSIWIGLKISYLINAAPIKVSPTATTFTVS